jgi:hypothetical protein
MADGTGRFASGTGAPGAPLENERHVYGLPQSLPPAALLDLEVVRREVRHVPPCSSVTTASTVTRVADVLKTG